MHFDNIRTKKPRNDQDARSEKQNKTEVLCITKKRKPTGKRYSIAKKRENKNRMYIQYYKKIDREIFCINLFFCWFIKTSCNKFLFITCCCT